MVDLLSLRRAIGKSIGRSGGTAAGEETRTISESPELVAGVLGPELLKSIGAVSGASTCRRS